MLQIQTRLAPWSADSRKQEQGPSRARDAGSREGEEGGGRCATPGGLLRFQRMTDTPLQAALGRGMWKGAAKV